MTEAFVTLNDQRCTRVMLHVPQRGAWHADVDLETDPDMQGVVTLKIGDRLTLTGTIVGQFTGVFGLQRRTRIVGGAGGWGAAVVTKAYHNDAGVKAQLVAEDIARAAGETLGQFVPARERLGNDYVRSSANLTASMVLEDVIGADVAWWVGFDGRTNVGQRPTPAALLDSAYKVLAYDPRARLVTLSIDDPALIQVGSVLAAESLPGPQIVREYEVQVDAQSVRILAWCGGSEQSAGRLAELWRLLVERSENAALFGLYLYRVVKMAVDGRVSLQAVHRSAGLPDIEPISQWPGVAGTHAELTPGAEVLVAFIEGDREQPIITHYVGKGGPGFVPVSLTLGGAAGPAAARQGDTVEVVFPPCVFVGTIVVGGVPSPATGIVSSTLPTLLGQISTGSGKVKVAT